jgi:hypothetical protein
MAALVGQEKGVAADQHPSGKELLLGSPRLRSGVIVVSNSTYTETCRVQTYGIAVYPLPSLSIAVAVATQFPSAVVGRPLDEVQPRTTSLGR